MTPRVNRKLKDTVVPFQPVQRELFNGERVFIIGGGPSLNGFNWSRLKGRLVLAINAAIFLMPQGIAKWGVFGDRPFFKVFRHKLREYVDKGGILFDATGRDPKPDEYWTIHLKRLNGTKNWGISTDPEWLRWNRSTGGTAINLAYLLGSRDMVLLGYDMQVVAKQHNFHDQYDPHYAHNAKIAISRPSNDHYRIHFMKPFPKMASELKNLGVTVRNANLKSALDVFPKCDLSEVL